MLQKCIKSHFIQIKHEIESILDGQRYKLRCVSKKMFTLSSVVIARVAMLLLVSVIKFSKSTLHAVTAAGCFIAT